MTVVPKEVTLRGHRPRRYPRKKVRKKLKRKVKKKTETNVKKEKKLERKRVTRTGSIPGKWHHVLRRKSTNRQKDGTS